MPATGSRRLFALAVTILLPCLICAGLALVVEQPFWRFHQAASPHSRAAVALRDDVIPFQKWGTKVFTLPYLEQYYDYTVYLTQSSSDVTQQEFIAALTQALARYDSVDIFLLAHTNRYIDWVATIAPDLRAKIRLVYNTGCYDAAQAQAWLQLGAHTAVAHPGLSDSPVFYFFFLRRWTLGEPLDQVVVASNTRMHSVFEMAGAATQHALDPDERFANSQALCVGACGIRIGD